MQRSPLVVLCAPNVAKRPNNTNRLYTLGLLLLRNVAERAGYRCEVVDAYFRGLTAEETAKAIARHGTPDVLGFTLNSREMDVAARAVLRALPSRPSFVVAGGYYATTKHEAVLEPRGDFDAVVLGEGESSFAELLNALARGDSAIALARIAGVATRSTIAVTRRPLVRDLDGLGELTFSACDEQPTADEWSLYTSRGCSAACAYCPIGAHWGKYRSWRGHSAEWVVRHLRRLVDDHGARHIQLVDDQFVGTPESIDRARTIVELLRARPLGDVSLYAMSRADTVVEHPELFSGLASVGLRTVFLGLESGNDEMLARWRKDHDVETGAAAVAILSRAGIQIASGTIVFHPWMTRESILRDLEFLERMTNEHERFCFYGLNELDIMEGTPLAALVPPFDWLQSWRADDADVQRIYTRWLTVQDEILFPAMRLLPIARNTKVRRAVGAFQIETCRALVELSRHPDLDASPVLESAHRAMAQLLLREGGAHAAAAYLIARERLAHSQEDHVVAERCFD